MDTIEIEDTITYFVDRFITQSVYDTMNIINKLIIEKERNGEKSLIFSSSDISIPNIDIIVLVDGTDTPLFDYRAKDYKLDINDYIKKRNRIIISVLEIIEKLLIEKKYKYNYLYKNNNLFISLISWN